MGEVYRARDTRLGREIALKVLPDEVAHDPGRLKRFEREARATASLSHPNVLTVFDVGSDDGRSFVVTEVLDGTTLAARLRRGPLPVREALWLAAQAARGLGGAHAKGIVHRDLKPENLFLTTSGTLKILDFGLARLQAAPGNRTQETTEADATGPGAILGTVSYMSPEQAKGLPVDARSDLFSLGVVLYEMLAGRHPFKRANSVETASAILRDEPPPLGTLEGRVPGAVEQVVRRCLEKRPEDRFETASDLALVLDLLERGEEGRPDPGLSPSTGEDPARSSAGEDGPRRRGPRLAGAAIAVLSAGALLGAASVWLLRPAHSPPLLVRTLLGVQPAAELNGGSRASDHTTPGGSRTAFAWTNDGRALVFAGRGGGVQQLFVRRLDQPEAEPLGGTEGAQAPVVSPDGQWVAFWAGESLRKVALSGGPVTVVAAGVGYPPFGLTWGPDGRLYYGRHADVIWQASPDGRTTPVTKRLETELSHGLPVLLPGGKALLFTARKRTRTWGDEEIVAQLLATGERRVLLHDAADARYAPSGHLVFLRRGILFAVAFDLERLEVRGEPVALLDGVAQALVSGNTVAVTGAGQFSVARTGTTLRLSPDGRGLLFVVFDLTEHGLWLYDMARETLTRLTLGGEVSNPTWSPDGSRIAFNGLRDGAAWLGWRPTDVAAPTEWLLRDPGELSSWSPTGGRLATVRESAGDSDIWIATLEGSKATLTPSAKTPRAEGWPEFSPDGKWLAYSSEDSGRFEVYVRPYPGPGPRRQVSVNGGHSPAWNPAGQELFFVAPSDPARPEARALMVVDIETSPELRLGTPRELFRFANPELGFSCIPVRCYDVSRDGQRFYANRAPAWPTQQPVTHVRVVLNWLEEVKARVPAAR